MNFSLLLCGAARTIIDESHEIESHFPSKKDFFCLTKRAERFNYSLVNWRATLLVTVRGQMVSSSLAINPWSERKRKENRCALLLCFFFRLSFLDGYGKPSNSLSTDYKCCCCWMFCNHLRLNILCLLITIPLCLRCWLRSYWETL